MNILNAETQTRPAHCETHGDYTSKNVFRSIWTKCPRCDEEIQQAEREAKERAERERRQRIWEAKIGQAGIPERFQNRTLTNYVTENDGQRHALEFAVQYADGFDDALRTGRGALFLGQPGTGKSHLACAIALRIMHRDGRMALFSTVMRTLRRIKDTWAHGSAETETAAIEAFVFPDLLILDEVGVQFGSDTEKLLLFEVLNQRYEQRLPTLMLSNLPLHEVRAYLGDRIFDRLREDGGQVVVFDWESSRGQSYVPPVVDRPVIDPLFAGCE